MSKKKFLDIFFRLLRHTCVKTSIYVAPLLFSAHIILVQAVCRCSVMT